MLTYFYNDLLFEVYHFISQNNLLILNKTSQRLCIIYNRIKRYVYHDFDNPFKTGDVILIKHTIDLDKYKNAFYDWRSEFYSSCEQRNVKIVKLMMEKINMNIDILHTELYYACRAHCINIIKMLIRKGVNNWESGLAGSSNTGNIKLVKMFMRKGKIYNWNAGLRGACTSGNLKLIKLMIKNGGDDWNGGLLNACYGNNNSVAVAKLMIKKGSYCLSDSLSIACKENKTKLIKLLIKKRAKYCNNCDKSIEEHLKKINNPDSVHKTYNSINKVYSDPYMHQIHLHNIHQPIH
jgi:ankyrin repeat protein